MFPQIRLHATVWDVITYPISCLGNDIRAWMSNYITQFYMDVIIYALILMQYLVAFQESKL